MVKSKFVSELSFITLNFECKDCKVFIGTSCIAAAINMKIHIGLGIVQRFSRKCHA